MMVCFLKLRTGFCMILDYIVVLDSMGIIDLGGFYQSSGVGILWLGISGKNTMALWLYLCSCIYLRGYPLSG
ncbi:hypothetical protein AAC387_Pa01g1913 [Persea americana]